MINYHCKFRDKLSKSDTKNPEVMFRCYFWSINDPSVYAQSSFLAQVYCSAPLVGHQIDKKFH